MKIDDTKLCEIIKESRENKNISQRELARRLNVNNAVIARIENGETQKPSFQLLKGLCRELKINLYDLLVKSHYTDEEIHNLGIIDVVGTKLYDANRIQKYISFINDDLVTDLVRIFKDYKNNEISLNDTFALISMATDGIDLTQYIPEELMVKYNIKNIDIIE